MATAYKGTGGGVVMPRWRVIAVVSLVATGAATGVTLLAARASESQLACEPVLEKTYALDPTRPGYATEREAVAATLLGLRGDYPDDIVADESLEEAARQGVGSEGEVLVALNGENRVRMEVVRHLGGGWAVSEVVAC